MSNGKLFDEKRKYVESLNDVLKVFEDFDYIKYARSYITEQEYVKVVDKVGGCAFLDVTAMSTANVLKEIAVMVLGNVPKSCIASTDMKRKIAPLFK